MDHEPFINRCLELAAYGSGNTAPNPLVGAVIVHEGRIIGEGFHRKHGEPHAEVNAVNSVENKELLPKSTIYVSLEPCSHYGKTPPCAELILKYKIPQVVICNLDPHEKVAGKGIKLLTDNGVSVISKVLEKKGNWLNRRFFTYHKQKRPYIILKWAENQNGLMDRSRYIDQKGINWITSPETKSMVHKWRAEEQAILVGANTVLNDSPKLNTRLAEGRDPLRCVIDLNSKIGSNNHFFDPEIPTVIYTLKDIKIKNAEIVKLKDSTSILRQVLSDLHERNILSVIIEGGAFTLNSFIAENLWDEARILIGQNQWKKGLKSPSLNGELLESITIGVDKLKIIRNNDLPRA